MITICPHCKAVFHVRLLDPSESEAAGDTLPCLSCFKARGEAAQATADRDGAPIASEESAEGCRASGEPRMPRP